MATSKFIIRGTNPSKNHSITLIFRYANTHLKYATGFMIHPKYWNEERQQVRNRSEVKDFPIINQGLSELKTRAHSVYNELISQNIQVSNALLRERIRGDFVELEEEPTSREVHVQYYLKNFIEEAPYKKVRKQGKLGVLRERTIKQYRTTLSKVQLFDTKRKYKVRFNDLHQRFYKNFVQFLQEDEILSDESVGTIIKNIKSISRIASQDGISVHPFVLTPDFFQPRGESIYVYLNEREIDQIYEYDLKGNQRLQLIKDMLVIGLYTGQRISDIIALSEKEIEGDYIRIKSQIKTGSPVVIPIHKRLLEILNRYDGAFPKMISPQKFNAGVKELCKQAGLTEPTKGTKRIKTDKGHRIVTDIFPKHELISSHTCRRSFATNYYGKIPTPVVMAITGHRTEKSFLAYIKSSNQEYAAILKDFWDKSEG